MQADWLYNGKYEEPMLEERYECHICGDSIYEGGYYWLICGNTICDGCIDSFRNIA